MSTIDHVRFIVDATRSAEGWTCIYNNRTFMADDVSELAGLVADHTLHVATEHARKAAEWAAKLAALPQVIVSARNTRLPYTILKATATQVVIADPVTPDRERWRFKRNRNGGYFAIGTSDAYVSMFDAEAAGLDAMCAQAKK